MLAFLSQEMEKDPVKASVTRNVAQISAIKVFWLHIICCLGLGVAFWLAYNVYTINLVSNAVQALRLIWLVEAPIVILLYSLFRQNPDQCSYLKAVGRGILGLPVGALVNAFGAIVLGAPIGIQLKIDTQPFQFQLRITRPLLMIRYFSRSANWSLLMSLFTVVPAASVFGSSWADWHRIFAHIKPIGAVDYMICVPAFGAIIGAWFGAWPMPLDWERPWQEWPICVTYGAIAAYLAASAASFGFVFVHNRRQHIKRD
ncbi:GPI biosynthesis protein Pig-F [Dillenia turbinata]|uniref:GPI biosynthesis protein Pig-F n=1 Tax=Dillenia turbinata TaxID=194707 RepID=A0AAN8WCR4_9MAGN